MGAPSAQLLILGLPILINELQISVLSSAVSIAIWKGGAKRGLKGSAVPLLRSRDMLKGISTNQQFVV